MGMNMDELHEKETLELIAAAKAGDKDAQSLLVEKNVGLGVSCEDFKTEDMKLKIFSKSDA